MTAPLPATIGSAALQLRLSGASYADIATTLGMATPRAALSAVTRELSRTSEGLVEERDEMRRIESARLDELLVGVMERATNPEDSEHLAAVRTAVTIVDRRIKLYGLDAPAEMVIHTPTQTELDQWVAQMVAVAMPKAALEEPDILDGEVIEDEPE
jgi:hypothetical protein